MGAVSSDGFGDTLRAARRAAGFSQEALAERAGLGIRTVQRLESGATRPYPATARLLATALVGSVAALALTAGGVMWMHGTAGGKWVTLAGFALVFFVMATVGHGHEEHH